MSIQKSLNDICAVTAIMLLVMMMLEGDYHLISQQQLQNNYGNVAKYAFALKLRISTKRGWGRWSLFSSCLPRSSDQVAPAPADWRSDQVEVAPLSDLRREEFMKRQVNNAEESADTTSFSGLSSSSSSANSDDLSGASARARIVRRRSSRVKVAPSLRATGLAVSLENLYNLSEKKLINPNAPTAMPATSEQLMYEITGELGNGNSANVYSAQSFIDSEPKEFAVKVFDGEGDLEHLAVNEARILNKLGELRAYKRSEGADREVNGAWTWLDEEVNESDKNSCTTTAPQITWQVDVDHQKKNASKGLVVMDIMPGAVDLEKFLDIHGERLSDDERMTIFMNIATELDSAHRKQIVHLDLKPANILINPDDYSVKIIDWAIGFMVVDDEDSIDSISLDGGNEMQATGAYAAPAGEDELFTMNGEAKDVWSLGCILYELLNRNPNGLPPFPKGVENLLLDDSQDPLEKKMQIAIEKALGIEKMFSSRMSTLEVTRSKHLLGLIFNYTSYLRDEDVKYPTARYIISFLETGAGRYK